MTTDVHYLGQRHRQISDCLAQMVAEARLEEPDSGVILPEASGAAPSVYYQVYPPEPSGSAAQESHQRMPFCGAVYQ